MSDHTYTRVLTPEPEMSYSAVKVFGADGVTLLRTIPASQLRRDRAGVTTPDPVADTDFSTMRPAKAWRQYPPRAEARAVPEPTVPRRSRRLEAPVQKQRALKLAEVVA